MRQEIERLAQELGLDHSGSLDGNAYKFYFVPSDAVWAEEDPDKQESLRDAEFDVYRDKVVNGVAAPLGLQWNIFDVRSTFNGAEKFLSKMQGEVGGDGRDISPERSSRLFRATVDSVLVPEARAEGSEGYSFPARRFAERFGQTEEEEKEEVIHANQQAPVAVLPG